MELIPIAMTPDGPDMDAVEAAVRRYAGKPIIIRGTFVITGPHPQDGPLGLDDEQIGRYAAMFADPEAPCRLPDGKTFMIPVHPIG